MEKKARPWLGATWLKFLLSRLSFLRSSQEGRLWSLSCRVKSGSTKVWAHLGQVLCYWPSGRPNRPEHHVSWKARTGARMPYAQLEPELAFQGSGMVPLHQVEWQLQHPWECEVLARCVSPWLGPWWSQRNSFDLNPLIEDWTEQVEGPFPFSLFWTEGDGRGNAMGRINLESCLPFCASYWQEAGWCDCWDPRIEELALRQLLKGTTIYPSKGTTGELSKQDRHPLHPIALGCSLMQELSMRCLGPETQWRRCNSCALITQDHLKRGHSCGKQCPETETLVVMGSCRGSSALPDLSLVEETFFLLVLRKVGNNFIPESKY